MLKMTARLFAVFLSVAAFIAIASIADTASADTCPAGQTAITADTRPLAHAAGIPDSAECWQPQDQNVGQTIAQAKQDLQQMWCGGSNASCSINGSRYTSTIDGLDPKFATCADKFMKQLRQQDPTACIRSAFRSTAHQACSCQNICHQMSCPGLCAAPGNSYHQKGLAIDVNHPRVSKQVLWQVASQSGLGNPNGLHNSDPDHIQVMTGGSTCSDIGYSPTDTDVFTPGPIMQNPYENYTPPMTQNPFQNPNTPFMPQAPVAQPQPQQPPTQPQQPPAQVCTPQYTCQGNSVIYQSTSCSFQTVQTCQFGCTSGQCNAAPTTIPTSTPITIPTSTPTSTPIGTPTTTPSGTSTPTGNPSDPFSIVLSGSTTVTSGSVQTSPITQTSDGSNPSWLDIIMSAAGIEPTPTSNPKSGPTGTSTHLNNSLGQISQEFGTQPQSATSSGAATGGVGPHPITTFVSDDLKTTYPQKPAPDPRLIGVVGQLRLALEKLVAYLSPLRPAVQLSQWSPNPFVGV